jgi:hypothetical protein
MYILYNYFIRYAAHNTVYQCAKLPVIFAEMFYCFGSIEVTHKDNIQCTNFAGLV